MDIHVRRIMIEPHTNRADEAYVFFETGKFSSPIFVLTAYEMQRLQIEIENQVKDY